MPKKKKETFYCKDCVYWDKELDSSIGHVCHMVLTLCRDLNVASNIMKKAYNNACAKFIEREPSYCQYCSRKWDKSKPRCSRCMSMHKGRKEREND